MIVKGENYYMVKDKMLFLHFSQTCECESFAKLQTTGKKVHHLIIIEGELTYEVGFVKHLVRRNELSVVVSSDDLSVTSVSNRVKGYYLCVSEDYMPTLLKSRDPFSPSFILKMHTHPIFHLDSVGSNTIIKRLEMIGYILHENSHSFQEEILELSLLIYFMEIGNMHLKQCGTNTEYIESDRKHSIFIDFMRFVYAKSSKKLSVSYVASHLCVTPQYLNRIVQVCSGRSVSEWINFTLINEIIPYLQANDLTIQQIADKYGFTDSTAFSKYFKRQIGMSPTEYRKRHSI